MAVSIFRFLMWWVALCLLVVMVPLGIIGAVLGAAEELLDAIWKVLDGWMKSLLGLIET